jgi:hypothetical protein
MLPLDAVFPQFRQSFHVKQWRTNAGDMPDYILHFAKCKTPFEACQFFFVFLQKKMLVSPRWWVGSGRSAGKDYQQVFITTSRAVLLFPELLSATVMGNAEMIFPKSPFHKIISLIAYG